MNHVALIGLGAMGQRIAKNLVRAGYRMAVYNRTGGKADAIRDLGATVADSPKAAAMGSDIVLSMVTDDQASKAVWLEPRTGALAGLRSGAVAIEMSTLTPSWVAELSRAVLRAGGQFIDAPVVGSRPQAESGQLVVLAGGEERTLREIQHVLSSIAVSVHHMGPTGSGAVAKLAVNFLFATQVAAVAEMLAVVQRSGIDLSRMSGLLGELPVSSPAALGALKLMMSRTFTPQFPIDLVVKDVGYFISQARGGVTQVPVAEAVRSAYSMASNAGHGGDNISGVVRLYDETAPA